MRLGATVLDVDVLSREILSLASRICDELPAVESNALQVAEFVRGQPDRGENTRVDRRARKREGNAVQKVMYRLCRQMPRHFANTTF